MNRWTLAVAACLGCLAVALGAFGAHALSPSLDARALELWHTANRYHFFHALALLGAALVSAHSDGRAARISGPLFALGTLVFSGTLYAMALGAPRWLGAITPIGGLSLMAGWAALGASAWGARGR